MYATASKCQFWLNHTHVHTHTHTHTPMLSQSSRFHCFSFTEHGEDYSSTQEFRYCPTFLCIPKWCFDPIIINMLALLVVTTMPSIPFLAVSVNYVIHRSVTLHPWLVSHGRVWLPFMCSLILSFFSHPDKVKSNINFFTLLWLRKC